MSLGACKDVNSFNILLVSGLRLSERDSMRGRGLLGVSREGFAQLVLLLPGHRGAAGQLVWVLAQGTPLRGSFRWGRGFSLGRGLASLFRLQVTGMQTGSEKHRPGQGKCCVDTVGRQF